MKRRPLPRPICFRRHRDLWAIKNGVPPTVTGELGPVETELAGNVVAIAQNDKSQFESRSAASKLIPVTHFRRLPCSFALFIFGVNMRFSFSGSR